MFATALGRMGPPFDSMTSPGDSEGYVQMPVAWRMPPKAFPGSINCLKPAALLSHAAIRLDPGTRFLVFRPAGLGRPRSGCAKRPLAELGRNSRRSNTNRQLRHRHLLSECQPSGCRRHDRRDWPDMSAAVNHRWMGRLLTKRHVPGAAVRTAAAKRTQLSMNHRYSPYRTCVSCDRSLGDFVVNRGREPPDVGCTLALAFASRTNAVTRVDHS